jgi:thymidine kinase
MSLSLVIGPMWAGKSSYILSKIRRYKAIGWEVFVITNALDHRYGQYVISNHDSDQYPATSVRSLLPLQEEDNYKKAKLIILEEAQFFEDLISFVLKAVEEDGKHVVCVGLDGDSERKPFGDILKLIPYCDSVEKITSFCSLCSDGTPALFSYRIVEVDQQIAVGADNLYKPLCRKHYLEKKRIHQ